MTAHHFSAHIRTMKVSIMYGARALSLYIYTFIWGSFVYLKTFL